MRSVAVVIGRVRVDRAGLAVAAVIGAVLAAAFVVAWATGSLHIPQNDDWSYVKSALTLRRTGHLHLQGWGQMFLVGQLLAAQPLLWLTGAHVAPLALFGLAAAAVWLSCTAWFARRLLSPWTALLVVIGLACWPGFGLLAASFMTDLPSAAAGLVCLVIATLAVRQSSATLLAVSLLIGVFAFTIREQLVAAPLAVVGCVFLHSASTRRLRYTAVAMGAAALSACLVLEHWRHGLPAADVAPFRLSTVRVNEVPPSLFPELFTTGLSLAPLCLWRLAVLRPRDWLSVGRLLGLAVGIGGLIWIGVNLETPNLFITTGNYFAPDGAFAAAAVGKVDPILPRFVMMSSGVLAALSGLVLTAEAGEILARPRSWWRTLRTDATVSLLSLFTAVGVLLMIVLAYAGQRQYDRYLMPVLPGLALLLMRSSTAVGQRKPRRSALAVFATSAAIVGGLSWFVTVSADTRDVARWDAAERLVQAGVNPERINAGLEWNGTHASTPAIKRGSLPPQSRPRPRWINLFPRTSDCYIVRLTPASSPGLQLLDLHSYDGDAIGAAGRVYTYKRKDCARTRASTP